MLKNIDCPLNWQRCFEPVEHMWGTTSKLAAVV